MMRPKKHKTTGSNDLFRARLDQIINMKHELVLLAGKIDWDWIDGEIAPLYSENGRPGIETRFMIGLLLLKHIYGLSDEGVCERWVHDPYFQFFTGEEFFRHVFPHERSDLSHWRKRLGDKLEQLLAESLRVAHETGALRSQDLKRVTVDTTVQPKAISFPTDAKLLHAAIRGLNRLARKHGVKLRQSYCRVAKSAAMMAGRYAHAKQFNRHQRQLRILRSRLGRIIRDIRRKIEGEATLEEAFALPLGRASQIRSQQQRQRGFKLYSFHAPEVECIGKGKAAAPYEFGVKASIVTNNRRAPGGLFVLHARSLPDNPYDGHTLRDVMDRTETLTGCAIERAYVDKGYRGHDAQNPRRVFISGQKRGVFGAIKRELRRRSAIEPIIGHLKAEGHLGRCYLKGRAGDAANVVLSAVGHNLRRILAWFRELLRLLLVSLWRTLNCPLSSIRLLNGRHRSVHYSKRCHIWVMTRQVRQWTLAARDGGSTNHSPYPRATRSHRAPNCQAPLRRGRLHTARQSNVSEARRDGMAGPARQGMGGRPIYVSPHKDH
ncbi:IS5 family transposase [Bradyrhizobium sp. USDA 4529]